MINSNKIFKIKKLLINTKKLKMKNNLLLNESK